MRQRIVGTLIVLLLAAAAPLAGQARTTFPSTALLSASTTTETSEVKHPPTSFTSYHAYGETTSGAGAATIVIEVSNLESPVNTTNVDWVTACTITLTLGTTRTGDGCAMQVPWRSVRARITAISGTNAAVTVRMGAGS